MNAWWSLPFATLVAATCAHAQDSVPAASPYDRNGNGLIDAGPEARVYALHQVNTTLKRYDRNFDGLLDDAEVEVLQREVSAATLTGDVSTLSRDAISVVGAIEDTASVRGGIPVAELVAPPKPTNLNCPNAQRYYVRRDRMDLNAYSQGVDQKEAKGAAISMFDEEVSDVQSVEARGVVSYIVNRACRQRPDALPSGALWVSGDTVAAWIQADGLKTDDATKDKSSLKVGLDFQWGLSGGPFAVQYLTLSPYLQSDFRGDGEAFGAQLSWEPYLLSQRVNGSFRPASEHFDFYWTVRGEADWLHVEDAGRTGLTDGTDYAWLGGTIGVTAYPLPEQLDYRLKLHASWRYHRDVNAGLDARHYSAGAAWNLTEDGQVSVSVEHSWGLERDKLVEIERTTASLNFKL